jgi:hypothetical protein
MPEPYFSLMPPCVIKGPYYPAGEIDWRCDTHGIEAELKDPAQIGKPPFKREDFYCPVGQPEFDPRYEEWRAEGGEPCDECGGRVKATGGQHHYNGHYDCYTLYLECENCGPYEVECV